MITFVNFLINELLVNKKKSKIEEKTAGMQIGILKYRYMEKREKNHRKMSNPKLSFFSFPQELQKSSYYTAVT